MRLTRRHFALALFGGVPVRAQSGDDFAAKVLSLEKPWNVFIRAYFGCGATGDTNTDTCKAHRSRTDHKAFEHAREAAKALFGLRD
jgi:hypothetical protein